MATTTIANGTTRTTRLNMSGTDILNVAAGGVFTVADNAQTVRFNAATSNGQITNSGTIENTNSGGRAIRVETGVGTTTFNATITNNAGGLITAVDDAIQVQASTFTGVATLAIGNAGTITSATGQALDLAGGGGTFVSTVTNTGTITAQTNDAVRIFTGSFTNTGGTVTGGSAAGYTVSADGVQFEDNGTGTLVNQSGGTITGDRHGVNAGVGSVLTVTNGAGSTITGNNGSGVGSDGSATITNYGTISGNFSDSAGSDINGSTPGATDGGGPDGINDGDGDGVDVDFQITLYNYGRIEGTGAGGTGSDGYANTAEGVAAGGGLIHNYAGATIIGLGRGILIDDSSTGNAPYATTIINEGTITGTQVLGIKIVGTQNDTIDNSGTISTGGTYAILMGDGNDTLVIRNGSSITGLSDGEAGTDQLDYSHWTGTGISVNLTDGLATGTGGVAGFENVTGSGLADLIHGSAVANLISGGEGDDQLYGWAGDDTLGGGAGNDVLYGGAGNDTLMGGTGDDVYLIEDLGDVISEVSGEGTDTAYVAVTGYTLGANVEYGYLVGAASALTAGSTGTNLIANASIGSVLTGGTGDDTLWSQSGNDTLNGGAGNDILRGSSGNDRFVGGAGDDQMVGGSGADTFGYEAASWGYDQIWGFSVAQGDKLDFTGSGLTYAELTVYEVGGSTVVAHGADRIDMYGVTGLTSGDFIFG
ncbi:calcium-binding protein [Rhodovarius crocodyli]|uniref:Calcium-binding protein n=1 Tax=Rhodovarius crocodyli TaxID=1979269 RepID=A0A437MM56_9PROT|nr:calcium-binding protein [Rhodovarius crocodyli]RVT98744.1 calcium-binding protein [Rhodovarius crocodyli]